MWLDGNIIVSGGKDDKIKLWNYKTGSCQATFSGHKEAVRSLSLSSENNIISGSEDKTIKVWKKNGKCIQTITGPLDYVRCVLGISQQRVVASTRDFELAVYSIIQGEKMFKLRGHILPVWSLVSINENTIASSSADYTIRIWNLEKKRQV